VKDAVVPICLFIIIISIAGVGVYIERAGKAIINKTINEHVKSPEIEVLEKIESDLAVIATNLASVSFHLDRCLEIASGITRVTVKELYTEFPPINHVNLNVGAGEK
jgi:hypothetical protein